jgi:hypothetical protein
MIARNNTKDRAARVASAAAEESRHLAQATMAGAQRVGVEASQLAQTALAEAKARASDGADAQRDQLAAGLLRIGEQLEQLAERTSHAEPTGSVIGAAARGTESLADRVKPRRTGPLARGRRWLLAGGLAATLAAMAYVQRKYPRHPRFTDRPTRPTGQAPPSSTATRTAAEMPRPGPVAPGEPD